MREPLEIKDKQKNVVAACRPEWVVEVVRRGEGQLLTPEVKLQKFVAFKIRRPHDS
jgi:hypothetical protein